MRQFPNFSLKFIAFLFVVVVVIRSLMPPMRARVTRRRGKVRQF